jgi:ectoine hydroxylase-related dioxygenase (phytanoyl-CoA dioxygenase family)
MQPSPASPPKREIFKNREEQALFDQFGYVTREFLSSGEIEELNQLFDETVRNGHETYEHFRHLRYYISVFDKDTEKRREVDHTVKRIFRDKIDQFMMNYRILLCNFMAKEPKGNGEIQVHQDFTFVDEDRFVGFNLWVPLRDTDLNNGCFYMLPGSNKLLRSYRASSIPDTLTQYNDRLKRYMTPKPLKAGHGIAFDHKLFHYSPNNNSEEWRPAVQLVLVPSEAQEITLHYDRNRDPNHLVVYKVDANYLTGGNLWQPPAGLEASGKKPYIPLPKEEELILMVEELRDKESDVSLIQ